VPQRRPPAVYELEHWGVPFSRTRKARSTAPVRRHDHALRKGTAQRTCAAADRTGHAMLHTLYGAALKHSAEFFVEYFVSISSWTTRGAASAVVALISTKAASTASGRR